MGIVAQIESWDFPNKVHKCQRYSLLVGEVTPAKVHWPRGIT